MPLPSLPGDVLPPRSRAGTVQVKGETTSQRLSRAKGYPYPRPATSFVFVSSAVGGTTYLPLPDAAAWPAARRAGSMRALLDLPVGPPLPACAAPTGAHSGASSTTDLAAAAAAAGQTAGPPGGAMFDRGGAAAAAGLTAAAALAPLGEALREGHGIDAGALLPEGTPLTPILAIGSNASPEQLARKFPPDLFPAGAVVPCIQCVLKGFDVVFAPLISSYGSATATLEASEGTEVEVFVTWLTPPLQQRMHETEGAYDLLRLDGVALLEGAAVGGGCGASVLTSVYQYNHSLGTLHVPLAPPDGPSPVALAEIPARGRRFPALTQAEMQAALMMGLTQQPPNGPPNAATQLAAVPLAAVSSRSSGPSSTESSDSDARGLTGQSSGLTGQSSGLTGQSGGGDGGAGGGWGDDPAVNAFILENLREREVRAARVSALAAHARAFSYPRHERLMTIGTIFSRNVE